MASLEEQIERDFIEAYKSKDKSLETLKMLKSAIKNAEIEKREKLTDEEIVQLLQKEKKQRKESIEEFKKGKRMDLAEKEEFEIKVVERYLPKQMSDEEIKKIVLKAIEESNAKGPQDTGKVMGVVMSELKGKAEGQKVAEIVKNKLSNR